MVNIVLNEKACVESALNNLSLGTEPAKTISRIARYYYGEGYRKREIRDMIESFILRCDPSANILKWQRVIDNAVNSADKHKLINISGIFITESELDKIKKINGVMAQKLMFTMLCLAKYGNAVNDTNNNWVNKPDKDIFSLANIKITSKRQSLMINDLWSLGYIKYSRVIDNMNINVNIVDNDSPIVLFITDFRELGNQYMRYLGDKHGTYIECECCGRVIRKNVNNQRYCKQCSVEVNRVKTNKRYSMYAAQERINSI